MSHLFKSRVTAGKVLKVIVSAGTDGINQKRIRSRLGISEPQFRRALVIIREELALAEVECYAYDFRRNVYSFPDHPEGAEHYEAARLKGIATEVRRFLSGTIQPALSKWKRHPEFRMVTKTLGRVAEDLEDALAMLTD